VFTGLVVGLACLFQLSAITILSNLGLGIMAFTLPVCLLYKAMTLVRLSDGSHPFQSYLDEDRTLTDEDTVRIAEQIVLLIATAVTELKRLFFIDSIMDSVKFVVFLYLLTYVGVQDNGLTLLMTGVICAFSLPLLYRLQQVSVCLIWTLHTGLYSKKEKKKTNWGYLCIGQNVFRNFFIFLTRNALIIRSHLCTYKHRLFQT
uniref:Reticulon n=1 Tax=Sinocyclocheilus anshuiensis TaxID=1608454 RepID=A0A671R5N5_9TELE